MDILLSKNGVKCAVFKISDVQIVFSYLFIILPVFVSKIGIMFLFQLHNNR